MKDLKITILDAETLGGDIDLSTFEDFGEFNIYQKTAKTETFERARNSDIIITNKVVFDRELLSKLPRLKLIALTATGMNNVDLEAAKEFGISVKNVAGYSTKSVAQHTILLVLSLVGKLRFYDDYVKEGKWCLSDIFTNLDQPFFEISGKRWGIIGLGEIGREVAKIASAFGAQVVYFSTSGAKRDEAYPSLELTELLKTSDIVTIHAPLNAKTKDLVGGKELALMKQDAIIVNVGRGGIVNEKALADAIESGKIYAASDVLEVEPMRKDLPLANLSRKDRFIITPHIAWGSVEARARLVGLVYKNIKEFVSKTD